MAGLFVMKKRWVSKTIIALAGAVLLTSCSTMQTKKLPKTPVGGKNIAKNLLSPALAVKTIGIDFKIRLPSPIQVSDKIKKIKIRDLYYNGDVRGFTYLMAKLGINTVYAGSSALGKEKILYIQNYNGTFGELINMLAHAYGLIFEQKGNVVLVKTKARFSAKIMGLPPSLEKALLDQIKAIPMFSKVSYSSYTDTLTWEGSGSSIYQMQKVLTPNVVGNYSRIDFDIIIFEASSGFTHKLKLGLNGSMNPFGDKRLHNGKVSLSLNSQPTTTTDGYLNGVMTVNQFNSLVEAIYQDQSGVVVQKLFLSTTNLAKGLLKEGENIPYVSQVTQSTNNTATSTSVSFDTALSGISFNINPVYLSHLKSVFAKVDIDVEGVPKMIEVKAGQDSYTRPETTTRKVNTSLIMQLGKVYVFGGFTVAKNSKFYSLMPVDFEKTKDNVYLFFAVRPRAVVFNCHTK